MFQLILNSSQPQMLFGNIFCKLGSSLEQILLKNWRILLITNNVIYIVFMLLLKEDKTIQHEQITNQLQHINIMKYNRAQKQGQYEQLLLGLIIMSISSLVLTLGSSVYQVIGQISGFTTEQTIISSCNNYVNMKLSLTNTLYKIAVVGGFFASVCLIPALIIILVERRRLSLCGQPKQEILATNQLEANINSSRPFQVPPQIQQLQQSIIRQMKHQHMSLQVVIALYLLYSLSVLGIIMHFGLIFNVLITSNQCGMQLSIPLIVTTCTSGTALLSTLICWIMLVVAKSRTHSCIRLQQEYAIKNQREQNRNKNVDSGHEKPVEKTVKKGYEYKDNVVVGKMITNKQNTDHNTKNQDKGNFNDRRDQYNQQQINGGVRRMQLNSTVGDISRSMQVANPASQKDKSQQLGNDRDAGTYENRKSGKPRTNSNYQKKDKNQTNKANKKSRSQYNLNGNPDVESRQKNSGSKYNKLQYSGNNNNKNKNNNQSRNRNDSNYNGDGADRRDDQRLYATRNNIEQVNHETFKLQHNSAKQPLLSKLIELVNMQTKNQSYPTHSSNSNNRTGNNNQINHGNGVGINESVKNGNISNDNPKNNILKSNVDSNKDQGVDTKKESRVRLSSSRNEISILYDPKYDKPNSIKDNTPKSKLKQPNLKLQSNILKTQTVLNIISSTQQAKLHIQQPTTPQPPGANRPNGPYPNNYRPIKPQVMETQPMPSNQSKVVQSGSLPKMTPQQIDVSQVRYFNDLLSNRSFILIPTPVQQKQLKYKNQPRTLQVSPKTFETKQVDVRKQKVQLNNSICIAIQTQSQKQFVQQSKTPDIHYVSPGKTKQIISKTIKSPRIPKPRKSAPKQQQQLNRKLQQYKRIKQSQEKKQQRIQQQQKLQQLRSIMVQIKQELKSKPSKQRVKYNRNKSFQSDTNEAKLKYEGMIRQKEKKIENINQIYKPKIFLTKNLFQQHLINEEDISAQKNTKKSQKAMNQSSNKIKNNNQQCYEQLNQSQHSYNLTVQQHGSPENKKRYTSYIKRQNIKPKTKTQLDQVLKRTKGMPFFKSLKGFFSSKKPDSNQKQIQSSSNKVQKKMNKSISQIKLQQEERKYYQSNNFNKRQTRQYTKEVDSQRSYGVILHKDLKKDLQKVSSSQNSKNSSFLNNALKYQQVQGSLIDYIRSKYAD